jgi:LmeA-like phospholipid-binding
VSARDTQPTQPIPDQWVVAAEPPRRRRRAWPWIVAFAIVIGLAIVAWFAGEAIAKDIVTKTIRDQVVTQLSLPADQEMQVDIASPIIPQLIAGTLSEVTITSEDVPMDSFVGDVTVSAQDIPIRGGGEMGSGTATVVLTEEQLRTLMATVDDFPVDSVGLEAPDVTMSTELSVFGLSIPVAAALTPSAVGGDIVLTPASLQLGGAEIGAEDLRDRFGRLAETVLRDWTVCIAQYIPAGLTLTAVAVDGEQVVADFDIDGAIISDPALQANGTCQDAS